jgi:hypothetical protein
MLKGTEKPDALNGAAGSSQDGRSDIKISLVRGGPFYRAQEAVRLLDANRWNLGRRITVGVAVAWVPLVILTALFNPQTLRGLLSDYPLNVRLLFAIPMLLVGQVVMENSFRKVVRHIGEAGLLTVSDTSRLDRTLVSLIRLRDSVIPEAVIVVLSYVRVTAMYRNLISIAYPWAVAGTGVAIHPSLAGWYFAVVSQFVYQFLLYISLWKWFLWAAFLFRLSRLDLQIVPTHPDRHGGLGFLGMSPIAIAPTAFVTSAAIGATWRAEILRQGLHLMDLKIPAFILFSVMLIIAFGPLAFFIPKLAQLRRQGILQYGILGQIHSTEFHKKWVQHRAGHEEEFLNAPEISALIDFESSFENIEKLQPFPFDKGAFVALVLSIALPMLPVVLAEIPLIEVLKGLLSALK